MRKTIVLQYLRKVYTIFIHKTMMLMAYWHNKLHQNFNFLIGFYKVNGSAIAVLNLESCFRNIVFKQ